ncbi:MAG: hypothetical protein Q8911_00120 [Bacillota bacterium]|nr:hypothetical protein [Bacillota bacterium]
MANNKDKTYKPHIKVYFETDEEVEKIKGVAKSQGLSASAWFRNWALKQFRKGRK